MENLPTELTLVSSLDRQVPALRSELSFRPQVFGHKTYYVVEDPLNARFFRIGAVGIHLHLLAQWPGHGRRSAARDTGCAACVRVYAQRCVGHLSVGGAHRAGSGSFGISVRRQRDVIPRVAYRVARAGG